MTRLPRHLRPDEGVFEDFEWHDAYAVRCLCGAPRGHPCWVRGLRTRKAPHDVRVLLLELQEVAESGDADAERAKQLVDHLHRHYREREKSIR